MSSTSMQRRKEQELEKKLIGLPKGRKPEKTGLTLQGFHVEKRTERFKSGKPDLRIGRRDFGQLDVELKYIDWPKEALDAAREVDTTMKKIQWLNMRTYNEHGMPCICLVYIEAYNEFVITTNQVLRTPLYKHGQRVLPYVPHPMIIDGERLFLVAREYLKNAGY